MGIMFKKEAMGPRKQAHRISGQSHRFANCIQLAELSAVVNGGTLYNRMIVKQLVIRSAQAGYRMLNFEPTPQGIISKETSDLMHVALEVMRSCQMGESMAREFMY